ncbi:MAG: DNA polymerase III subunit gamma/tau [Herpetosiphon sp.]
MSGQALYRKWRSQTFDELVGQEHVVQTLRNALRSDRIAHAYLFTGPRGVGKTTMARLLAKAVNCLSPLEQRPCDHCAECRAIADGRAVDVVEMDAASHTGVDDARDLIEKVQFRPSTARIKVYIIDEVHMLSTAAFNALLKTLEEPPPHVLFILATTEIHKVPATIVSRCQRFVFARHSLTEITTHLEHIASSEKTILELGVAERIARAATGAMRDALSVLDQLMAASDHTVTLAQVQQLLGMADTADVGTLVQSLVDGDIRRGLQTINEVADNGADLRQFARDLVDRLRSLMLLCATHDTSGLDLPESSITQLQSQSEHVSVITVVQWLKLFTQLDSQLKQTPYGQLPIELALVEALTTADQPPVVRAAPRQASIPQLASAPTTTPVSAHIPRPAVSRAPAPIPTVDDLLPPAPPTPDPQAEPPVVPGMTEPLSAIPMDAAPQQVDVAALETTGHIIEIVDDSVFLLEDVEAVWEQFREDVRAESPLIHAQMQGITPINVEGHFVVLLATQPWRKEKLENERTLRKLERMLSKLLNNQAQIRLTVDQHEEMPDERKLIQHARKDALVRKAINIFEAQIVEIQTP